jgi:hypothetical protein
MGESNYEKKLKEHKKQFEEKHIKLKCYEQRK